MVKAWYMDSDTNDQRLEHHRNPPEFITLEDLYKKTGVEYFKINVTSYKTDGVLDKIKKDRGYTYEDEITCSKECLPNYEEKIKSFYEEHLHTDEEIRLVLDGSGYFDVRDGEDQWIRIAVTAGDMIVIPSGIYHRFTLDTNNFIHAKRFFIGEPVWLPYNRPADDMPARREYLHKLQTMVLKLYAVSEGPPSMSVRQALTILEIPFQLINVDYGQGEHMTADFAKMNPQKEIPVLDDEGFFLSESNAILQYICDKYKPESNLYPKEPKARAIVNHRLCFNLSTYYANIAAYTIEPVFYDYERTEFGLKKVHRALDVLETYFESLGTSYAAADHLTIADFPLINTNMTMEAIGLDFSKYKRISKWYNDFKKNYPELWKISEGAMKEVQYLEKNPPDLSHLNHPIHPMRKINK